MVTHPDPTLLYPDIAARGSLGAALQAAADEAGLSVSFTVSESDPLTATSVVSRLPHRNPLGIGAAAVGRWWSIWGADSFQGLAVIDGRTTDLIELARAAYAWHVGAALDEVHDAAPFVHLTGRFEVPDNDPAQLAESEWRHLLTQARELEYAGAPAYRALVEAAYSEPALRALYPFTSHFSLRFSSATRPHLAVIPVSLNIGEDKGYEVSVPHMGGVVAETATAQAAVSTAVEYLPPRLGPVTPGIA